MSRAVQDAMDRVQNMRRKVSGADDDKPGLATLTPKQRKVYDQMKKEGTIYTSMLPVLGVGMEWFLRMAQVPKAQHKKNMADFLAYIE